MHRPAVLAAASAALLALVAAPAAASPATQPTVPAGPAPWQTVAPEKVGLDKAKLDAIAQTAAGAGNTNCLLVVRHGRIAGEWYWNGATEKSAQNVFSVTKSVTSTLVGIAQDERKLRIRDSASKYLPEWKGTPAEAVTVQDLLSNDSGREWSATLDYDAMIKAPDRTAFSIGLKQTSPPNQVWVYNNSAIQTLSGVLKNATGQKVNEYAQQKLFAPLGMADTRMNLDASGGTDTFQGLNTTCRDLARFGQMALRWGRAGGEKVVSARWIAEATGRPSQDLNAAYGYLWWLNRKGTITDPLTPLTRETAEDPATPRTRLVPTAPAGTFWALGLGNQVVQVDRGTDTVVVRLGSGAPKGPDFGAAQASRVVTEAVARR